jgi:hypothetical protein
LALVAAALAYADKQKTVSTKANADSPQETSRWVLAGRKALLTSRL